MSAALTVEMSAVLPPAPPEIAFKEDLTGLVLESQLLQSDTALSSVGSLNNVGAQTDNVHKPRGRVHSQRNTYTGHANPCLRTCILWRDA